MKPLERLGEAFHPYVVQGGFGTVSSVAVSVAELHCFLSDHCCVSQCIG